MIYLNKQKNEKNKFKKAKWSFGGNQENKIIYILSGYENNKINDDMILYYIEDTAKQTIDFFLVIQNNFHKYIYDANVIDLYLSIKSTPYEMGFRCYVAGALIYDEKEMFYNFIIYEEVEDVIVLCECYKDVMKHKVMSISNYNKRKYVNFYLDNIKYKKE